MTTEPSPNLAQIVAGVHRLAQAAQRLSTKPPPRHSLPPLLRKIAPHQHRDGDCCRVGACCNVPDV